MIQFQKATKPVLAPMQKRLKANHLAAVTPGAAVTRPDNGFSYSPINGLNIKERKKKTFSRQRDCGLNFGAVNSKTDALQVRERTTRHVFPTGPSWFRLIFLNNPL